VKIGDSDALEVGEWVLAIGSPFGLEHTATQGIVSAVGRNLPSGTYVPFIQSDVAVNPGSSGGRCSTCAARWSGINSQIYSSTGGYMGLSFAIPIKLAMQVVEQIKATGEVTRGWLGVLLQAVNNDLAEAFKLDRPRGALVAQILPDSPAASAGFKQGDIILRYGGEPVEDSSQLPRMIGVTPVGKTVRHVDSAQRRAAGNQGHHRPAGSAPRKPCPRWTNTAIRAENHRRRSEQRTAPHPGHGRAAAFWSLPWTKVRPPTPACIRTTLSCKSTTPVKNASQFVELAKELPKGKAMPLLVRRESESLYLAVRCRKRLKTPQ
jgi:serine protease Do